MTQLNFPPLPPEPQTLSPNLVVKGRVNIYARDIIATTPLEDLHNNLQGNLGESLRENSPTEVLSPAVSLGENPLAAELPEELPEKTSLELAARAVERDRAMAEYHQLQYQLLLVTLSIALIIFISVWIVYSLSTALNYLLGGCTGVVYLKMLARDVERLGNQKDRLGYARLAPFIGLMIIATRWHDLQIVPIFLGFLTYKAAIIVYVLKTSFR